jgi:DNA polymerase III subunit gamma/tau
MSYVVLARKWRPQQFADVLGQEHVTRTITNAINAGRIAHAFLFSGPRGVGKTSAARILAKALCCEKDGKPTATPCGVCRQCLEITEGRSTDVFEIDAASHTGVDNVREIIDNVRYLPSSARFKIYVIDEVHMLSTGAFNALLKTLEEPPLHVKFILATTDVHKVPVTILSRCQRYDFRRIPLAEIAARLSGILQKESLDHDPSALSLIAREAEGSMRDAQSLLEQVLAFADGRRLDAALVRDALGVVDGALIRRAFDALLEHRPGEVFGVASEVHDRGLDVKRFADALVEEARDLLAARIVADPDTVIDRPKDEIAELVSRAKSVDSISLERIFEQLSKVVEDVGNSEHPRFTLEIGLAAIAERPERVPVEELLQKLAKLESALAAVPPSPASPVKRTQADWRAPQKSAPAPYSARTPKRIEDDEGGFEATMRAPPAQRPAEREPPAPEPEVIDAPGDATIRQPPAEEPPPPPQAGTTTTESVPAAAGGGFAGFVDLLKRRRPSLAATLAQVRPLQFKAGETELGCETAFDENKMKDQETRTYLENLLSEYFGAKTTLHVTRTQKAADAPKTITEVEDSNREARRSEKGSNARSRPAVQAVSEELGATISKVRVIDEG